MFKHHLRIFYINFKQYKTTFFINIIGLSTGLACSLLIYLWIYDELNVDKFHKNDQRLFKVMVNTRDRDRITTGEAGSVVLGQALKNTFPEVEYAVATTPASWFRTFNISYGNTDNAVKGTGNFVGKDYFNVFSYKLIQGDKDQVLTDNRSMVISSGLARKLFRTTENVVGKVVRWKWYNLSQESVITGVYEDFPHNSSAQFDFVLTLDAWGEALHLNFAKVDNIDGGPFNNFLVLKEGTAINKFNEKIADFVSSKFPESGATLLLAKYSDSYLYGTYENGAQAGGRIQYIKLFSIIAICILVIACINFMNLSTAKAAERLKEIGVKKVLGVERSVLIKQFLGESLLLSFMALIIALGLVFILLPQFNALTGKELIVGFDTRLILSVIGVTMVTGLIAGIYPAIYLSRLRPVLTLKGSFKGSTRDLWVRRGLVFFQFSLSVIFIVTVMVVYNQVKFIQSKKPGYDKDHVVYFEMQGKVAEQRDRFLAELSNIPGVVQASSIMNTIVLPAGTPEGSVTWDNKNADDKIKFYQTLVNYNLIETLGIEMAAGRTFSRNAGNDSSAIIVNEAAVKAMGITNPIGKTINVSGGNFHIVGVTRNFHFNSLHEEIKPFIFRLQPKYTLLIMARINKGDESKTIQAISRFYKKFNPGLSLDYKFLDEDYQLQYTFEILIARLSKYFAGLAIIISCLGLFGLAAFTAEKRIKEIGIRKTLGASRFSIVYLLSADFTKIVIVSLLVGLPVSFMLANSWLTDFAYRIPLKPGYFIGTIFITLVIAWLTIAIQTIKASMVNPVKCLKED